MGSGEFDEFVTAGSPQEVNTSQEADTSKQQRDDKKPARERIAVNLPDMT
jgi:hypothetical protein